jgi:predicted nuclease with TOPRIM domain
MDIQLYENLQRRLMNLSNDLRQLISMFNTQEVSLPTLIKAYRELENALQETEREKIKKQQEEDIEQN